MLMKLTTGPYKINGGRFDDSGVVESDFVLSKERIPVTGHQHIFIPVKHNTNWTANFFGSHSRCHADGNCSGFFSSKSSLSKIVFIIKTLTTFNNIFLSNVNKNFGFFGVWATLSNQFLSSSSMYSFSFVFQKFPHTQHLIVSKIM